MPRKQYYDKMKNQPGYFSIKNMTIATVFIYLILTFIDSRDIFIGYIMKLNIDDAFKTRTINKYIRLSQAWSRITKGVYALIVVVFIREVSATERMDYVLPFLLIFMFIMKKMICDNKKPTVLNDPRYIRFCS